LYVKTETYEIFRHPEGDRKASCGGQLKAKIQSQNSTSIAPAVNPANQEPPSTQVDGVTGAQNPDLRGALQKGCAAACDRALRQGAGFHATFPRLATLLCGGVAQLTL
jgi:hypothetical protein